MKLRFFVRVIYFVNRINSSIFFSRNIGDKYITHTMFSYYKFKFPVSNDTNINSYVNVDIRNNRCLRNVVKLYYVSINIVQ